MVKKENETSENTFVAVESALTRTERYIEDNRKILGIVLGIIILVVGGYFGYKKLYIEPMEQDAQSEMFVAEQYFEKDSFQLALTGNAQYPGFEGIIEDYSGTKASNLAKYYAGVCCLRLGKYEEAIDYLSDFSSDDKMLSVIAVGCTGDANMELGKKEEALALYKKAAEEKPNEFLSPIYMMKYAFTLERLDRWEEALAVYERIDKEYHNSNEAKRIEKYITRAKLKLNK